MATAGKQLVKSLLGQLPFTAELYWLFRQNGKPVHSRFSLKHLQNELPGMAAAVNAARQNAPQGKHVFIFATLHYWIEHAAVLGMALAGQGHKVSLGFLPYADWMTPANMFDLRRCNAYAQKILKEAAPHVNAVSFLSQHVPFSRTLPDYMEDVNLISTYDTQYTLQVEEIDEKSEIFKMRLERNRKTAHAALGWMRANKPDVVIVPNGTIQELGVVYRMARRLKIPVVTYEFGDQRQRIWLGQNAEVMRQDTDALWKVTQDTPLEDHQWERLRGLFMARQRGALWENFARLWQNTPSQGGEQARQALGLDSRPVVLLATNVLGDSLTLGRQVFSRSMEEWISRTVQYFAGRPEIQLVIRVHPGEVLTHGTSMVDVVRQVLPKQPEHIRLIGPKEKVNTYDLVEVTDLGLVYTTTVGMEMAMNGLPVIVAGQTHYRGKGFTKDPDSWVSYFKQLGFILENPESFRLTKQEVERAWNYAYRFFFEYPLPFPWHLLRLWEDYKNNPLSEVLSPEGMEQYGDTFRYLTGEPVNWKKTE
jgi:hypothetical protein